jgi:two-component system response regulator FixJ
MGASGSALASEMETPQVDRAQTVHIIDDDGLVLHSVELFLETAGFETKSYKSAQEFVGVLDKTTHGCIVTDVRMPEMSGIDLLIKLHQSGLTLPVIVMTGHADVALAVHAMKQGAFDFIEKPFHAESLIAAVQRALDRSNGPSKASNARLAMLSSRENEVLNGLLQGKSNKVIGRDLNISERTVECHRANVMRKTGAGSVAELVRMAVNVK